MSIYLIGIILTFIFFAALASGMWVSFALLGIGILGLMFNGNDWGFISAGTVWSGLSVWSLSALPMFLWMGEILFRTKLSKNLFDGLSVWFNRVPGKLLHTNILSCGIFAAVSGSSAATVATIGNITLTHMKRLGYERSISIGTLGGSGTLGLLIPPSIVLIVFGVAADVSVARLFMAGVFPGILLMSLFSLYVIVYVKLNPSAVPSTKDSHITGLEKWKATLKLIPVLSLILGVLGSIYAGIATPTEAAAIGVVGSLLLGKLDGSLSKRNFIEGLLGAVRLNAMLLFIIGAANVLSISMAYIGIPRELASWIGGLGVSSGVLLIFLAFLFIILGCFLDGISIILLTTSVILPIIKSAGIDLIWFSIYLVLLVEMAQITPPVGFNLFVLQSLTHENIFRIAKHTLPFFFIIMLTVFIIWLFPDIVTYLPRVMTSRS
ncbi:MAG: TRAP transporter large permease subunit [SAR324 cluster bacterium]|nr:TRAP transporter large permease subunit [SAR324 cluster bacterium]